MAFRAVHQQWGTVFAHLPDLGCGHGWEEVWKARPLAPISCDECRHPMHAKTSRAGMRFFAHAPGAPNCALGLESAAHHLLKLELATAAREAGAHAELEFPGPGGTWRADVLATHPGGAWKTALEAQLAAITDADITARTERMRADGVTSIWFSDRPRPPWLGTVPSIRLMTTDTAPSPVVAEGLVKFDGRHWTAAPPTPLADFLLWVFTGKVVTHTTRAPMEYPLRSLPLCWTAPQYIKAEDAYLAEAQRQLRIREARQAELEQRREEKRKAIRASNAISRAQALAKATGAEQAARSNQTGRLRGVAIIFRTGVDQAIAKLADEHGVTAAVGWSTGDPRYAGGIPLVDENDVPVAVLDPEPARVRGDAFLLLAGLLLLFAGQSSQERFEKSMQRTKYKPLDGFRTDFVSTTRADSAALTQSRPERPAVTQCGCAVPQLVAEIEDGEHPAEPSERLSPAAALYSAKCRNCGGQYNRPWRRADLIPPVNPTTPG